MFYLKSRINYDWLITAAPHHLQVAGVHTNVIMLVPKLRLPIMQTLLVCAWAVQYDINVRISNIVFVFSV